MVDFTSFMERGMKELSTHGAFLTVMGSEGINTMTVSWGFVGFMWEKPHFITVVRPQRYTKEILDSGAESFTISIPFSGNLKEELDIVGSKSGRDIDKSEIVKYKPGRTVDSPVVAGCNLYYECAIDLSQQIDGELLAPVAKEFYKNDFHYMYFGEIVDCY